MADLNRLRAWAGHPSLRRMRDLAAAAGRPGETLPTSTVHEILAGRRLPRLPRLQFVETYVRACLRAYGTSGVVAEVELERWRRAWRRLAAAPAVPVDPVSASDRRPPDPVPVPAEAPTPAEARTTAGPGSARPATAGVPVPVTAPVITGAVSPPVSGSGERPALRRGSCPLVAMVFLLIGILVGALGAKHLPDDAVALPPSPSPACRSVAPDGPAGTDLIRNGTFDRPIGLPWWSNSAKVELTVADDALVGHVMGGTSNPWDAMIVHSGLRLRVGEAYRLSFRAASSRPVRIRVTVQDDAPPEYVPAMVRDVQLGPWPCRIDIAFAGTRETATGELTFQVGGGPTAFSLTLDDVSLLARPEGPPHR